MSELAPSRGKYPAGATLRVRPPLKHRLKKLAMFDATRKTVISKTLGNWICFTEVTNIIINVFQQYQGHPGITQWIVRQNSSNNLGNKQQDDTKIEPFSSELTKIQWTNTANFPHCQPTTSLGQILTIYHQNGGVC